MPAPLQPPSLTPPVVTWTSERTLRLLWGVPASDHARRARAWCEELRASLAPGVLDIVPGIRSLTILTDPLAADRAHVQQEALRVVCAPCDLGALPARAIELPVCFDDDLAPDLVRFPPGTIDRLLTIEFRVALLGFAPGFAYLDGLPPELHTPRLERPRPRVAPGSLAIGGGHAAIYPGASPGGWNLIGRTSLTMFDPTRERPALLGAGDTVRFVRIDRDNFDRALRESP